QLDVQGEAHEALGTAVASYGQRVLSDPHTLGNLVADLLPDLPRERSLLVTGAEAGVATEMRQHVEEQRIDPDTAVQLVARSLSERRAIDTTAGLWVVSEYAQALGYQVRPYTAVVAATVLQAPGGPSRPPAGQAAPQGPNAESWPATQQAPPRPPGQFWQPPQLPPAQPLPSPGPQSWPPAGASPQSWPPAGPPPQSWPPAGSAPGQSWPPQAASGGPKGSWSGRKIGLIAAGTAVAVIGGYLIAATFTHVVPFAKPHPAAAASSVHSARPALKRTQPATPAPTGPRLAAGVTPLVQLLPGDIIDPTTQCQNDPPPYPWDMPGRVAALSCDDPNLGKGHVYAYQVDSQADFESTWQSFNKVYGIGENSGSACPPAKGGSGITPWHAANFPGRTGQVAICEMVQSDSGKPQPMYAWAMPTQDAIIIAVGAPNSSFAALDKWFATGSMPLASPSPAAS
ncbi:MAG TPA: hypothetical protein VFV73_14985, partial [Streptosporangiaceae bacterium]|nr:hypothetical protein [Streptosporangiaceae bacterium]